MTTKTVSRLLALALLLSALHPLQAQAAREGGQKLGIAAIVNDMPITFSDIRNRSKLYLSGAPENVARAGVTPEMERQVLNRLIDEKLQLKEAEGLGITVSQEMIEDGFATLAKQNGIGASEFASRLTASGVRPETLKEQIKADLAWAQVVRRKLRPQINVSESEIDSARSKIERNTGKKEYQVAEIFLAVTSDETERLTREKAEELVKQIAAGAQFSKIARANSQAPGAATGGDLGWLQEGQLDAKLDETVRGLQPGQISSPVRTDKGYHVMFLRNVREIGLPLQPPAPAPAQAAAPQPAASPATVTKKIKDAVLHLRQIVIPVADTDPAPVVAAKTSRAQSLKDEIKSCTDMEQKAADFLAEGTGDLGKGALSQLPPPLRAAVENLPVDTLSEPVKAKNGIAVLMVCAREETETEVTVEAPAAPEQPAETAAAEPEPAAAPVAAPAAPTQSEALREQIANDIGMKRLDQMQERYLRDLRATAHIERRI